MENLKDFMNTPNEASKELALKQVTLSVSKIALTSHIVSSSNKADKFSQEVTQLVSSDQVISELSDKVGVPLPNETESEFIERAKRLLKKILMARLSR